LGELETQVRLRLVKDLLPVADALDASLRAARELPLVVEPAQPAFDDSWLARLRLVLAGPPADPTPTTPAPATDRRTALDSWLQGLLLVERRLQALLEREGVRPIAALGQPFDPYRHLAVAVAGNGSGAVPDGTIVGEELRGYTYGDRVLRHAEVVVARNQVTHDRGARVGIKGAPR
jgi:molecular chaperone GrpE (heat shock protein)